MIRNLWLAVCLLDVGAPAFAAEAPLDLYLPSYEASRAFFRDLAETARRKFRSAEVARLAVPSHVDSDLTIDTLYVAASDHPEGLVVMACGVHGAEAFAACAVQRQFMRDYLLRDGTPALALNRRLGFLMIHAVNPYGFKYGRRATENNVDLNRNFSLSPAMFAKRNRGYAKLASFLAPAEPANAGWFHQLGFVFSAARALMQSSLAALTQAIAEGQYEYPRGIFYGGHTFEPQRDLIQGLVQAKARGYGKALLLDLHTGYGRRGYMHLYPNPPDTTAIRDRTKATFGEYPIESSGDGTSEFYSNDGDFSTFLSRVLEKEGKATVPMLVEYGTLDSQTYLGSVKSLSRMVLENQAHWHGTRTEHAAETIREDFRELFYPSAPDWRTAILEQSARHFPTFLEHFDRYITPAAATR